MVFTKWLTSSLALCWTEYSSTMVSMNSTLLIINLVVPDHSGDQQAYCMIPLFYWMNMRKLPRSNKLFINSNYKRYGKANKKDEKEIVDYSAFLTDSVWLYPHICGCATDFLDF